MNVQSSLFSLSLYDPVPTLSMFILLTPFSAQVLTTAPHDPGFVSSVLVATMVPSVASQA